MNARAAFKIAVTVFVLFLALGVLALVGTWAYKKYCQVHVPLPAQVIDDSLKAYHEQAATSSDLSNFHLRNYEKLTQYSDSVSTDSAAFAHLVAEYRANLRAVITSQILDSIARQRGEIRAFETTYVDTAKKLRIHGTGKPGPEK